MASSSQPGNGILTSGSILASSASPFHSHATWWHRSRAGSYEGLVCHSEYLEGPRANRKMSLYELEPRSLSENHNDHDRYDASRGVPPSFAI